jgi:hypothetical protein
MSVNSQINNFLCVDHLLALHITVLCRFNLSVFFIRLCRVSFRQESEISFSSKTSQTGFGAQTTSYSMFPGGSFPEGQALEAFLLTTHVQSSEEVENERSYTSTPPISLHGVKSNFTTHLCLSIGLYLYTKCWYQILIYPALSHP